jgi:hypothetical protein
MRTSLACLAFLVAGGAHAGDGTYEVTTTGASGDVGSKAKASVTIKAKQGWHLNHEAPLGLKLTPTTGIDVDKAKLGRTELALSEENEARFDVAMTLTEPGKKTIDGETSFVLCQKDACRPIKEKVALTVDATTAPAAPAPSKTSPNKAAKPATKKE